MAYYAGPYTVTWNSLDLGQAQGGIRVRNILQSSQILNDEQGIIDLMFRSKLTIFTFQALEVTHVEALESTPALINWGEDDMGHLPDPGKFAVQDSVAKVLVATPVNSAGVIYTANKAILLGDVETIMNAARVQPIPLQFLLLPYQDSGDWVTYVPTAK